MPWPRRYYRNPLCKKGLYIGILDYVHQGNIIQHCIPLFSCSCYSFRFIWGTAADCMVHNVQLLCLGGDQIEATGIKGTVLYGLDTSTKPPVARSETFNKLSHNKSYIELWIKYIIIRDVTHTCPSCNVKPIVSSELYTNAISFKWWLGRVQHTIFTTRKQTDAKK